MTPPQIVTLAEAKLYLRLDNDALDGEIEMLVEAATEAVLDVADGFTPWEGEPVPARIKLAILSHVRQAFDSDEVGVSAGAQRLLSPLRRYEI